MFESLKKQPADLRDRPSASRVMPDSIIQHALGKTLCARLAHNGGGGLALIVKVPSASWCGLIETALDARFRHTVQTGAMRAKRRGSYNKKDGAEELLTALGNGLSAVAISPDPEETVAPEFHAVADHVLEIEGLDVKLVRHVIRKVTGEYAKGLKQEHLTGVGPHEAMAAIGSGVSADDCVVRLRRIRQRKSVPSDLSHVPELDKLPLTAPVREWVDGLTSDICRVDAGTIAASGLRYGVLDGPPGTGKTLLASAIGKATGWRFVKSSVQDWFNAGSGDLGAVTKAAADFIDSLLAEDRCIGFIDELQSIPNRETLTPRGRDWWLPVVDGVLMQIDRVRQSGKKILLLGACNHYHMLDPALVRPGRLETRVSVLPPSSVEEAGAVLGFYLNGRLKPDEVATLANLAVGCSPATIEATMRQAEGLARKAGRDLEVGDLVAILASDDRDDQQALRIALHEAGHAVVAHRLGTPVTSVSIIAKGSSAGSTVTQLMNGTPSVSDIEAMILIGLAGRATDELLGTGAHAGAAGDLAKATGLLVEARNSWGLYGRLAVPEQMPGPAHGADQKDLHDWVESQLARLMERARAMVVRDETAIRALAAELLKRKVLHGTAIIEVIAQAGERKPTTPSITVVDGSTARPDTDKIMRTA